MALREELEVMFTKVVIKPVIVHGKKHKEQENASKSSLSPQSHPPIPATNDSENENEEFIQVSLDQLMHEDLVLEMSFNFLLETLLILDPKQISALFLMYDC